MLYHNPINQRKGFELNTFLDVRSEEEFSKDGIESTLNIPHSEVVSRIDELDKSKRILIYCRSGKRAEAVTRELTSRGYNVQNIMTLQAARRLINGSSKS